MLVAELQNNKVLARRLLSKELEPVKVINMSPSELKVGNTTMRLSWFSIQSFSFKECYKEEKYIP